MLEKDIADPFLPRSIALVIFKTYVMWFPFHHMYHMRWSLEGFIDVKSNACLPLRSLRRELSVCIEEGQGVAVSRCPKNVLIGLFAESP